MTKKILLSWSQTPQKEKVEEKEKAAKAKAAEASIERLEFALLRRIRHKENARPRVPRGR